MSATHASEAEIRAAEVAYLAKALLVAPGSSTFERDLFYALPSDLAARFASAMARWRAARRARDAQGADRALAFVRELAENGTGRTQMSNIGDGSAEKKAPDEAAKDDGRFDIVEAIARADGRVTPEMRAMLLADPSPAAPPATEQRGG